MWLLITSTGKLIYLKSNILISIGRKKSDILLQHDTSISRLHASIVVRPHKDVMIGEPTSLCILKDEGSKYGTYISKNETFEKVTNDINLKDQDVIRIGLYKEIFTVTYIPIITMVSALQDNEKDKLLEIMNVIDGIITTDWNKYCTHLTVVKPKLTQKVAISLAAGIPIVSIDYWHAVKCIIEKGDPLPKTDNFIPEMSEQYISKEIISLSQNCKRKTLFTNLTFNFFSLNQYEMYRTMIKLAGGKSVLSNLNNKPNNALNCDLIFVQYSSTDSTQFTKDFMQQYDYICKKLNTHKRRVIPESEIPLAILHCSTERYCNPKYNFGNVLKRQKKADYNLSEILVLDTQEQDILIKEDFAVKQGSCGKSKNYVNETLENDDNVSVQEDAMSQENLDSTKKLTPQIEHTAFIKPFIPETIESSYDSQRNAADCSITHVKRARKLSDKQNSRQVCIPETIASNHSDSSESNNKKSQPIDSSLIPHKKLFISETIESSYDSQRNDADCSITYVKRARKLSDKQNSRQVCIPETIASNHFNSSESNNKKSQPIDSFLISRNFSKANDSNDVSIKKQPRKGEKNVLIPRQNVSQAVETKNIESHEKQKEAEVEEDWITVGSLNVESFQEIDIGKDSTTSFIRVRKNPPGKTFKKAYVKIPERRTRQFIDIIDED
ncbi:hypothetical protein KPH14_011811 [Odynerus spinipes]|uniref:FHA domain-containing protein n=1 Tax=Odynerus spinipes TaxID=1348599 RepID=A0AAD9RVN6_9HYME|nr:hypothetical protein KPH14_011811 [Odynerus spinipes]